MSCKLQFKRRRSCLGTLFTPNRLNRQNVYEENVRRYAI